MNKALIKAFIEAKCEQGQCWDKYVEPEKEKADELAEEVMFNREQVLKEFYSGPVHVNYSVMGDENYFSNLRDLDFPPIVVETIGPFYKFMTKKLPTILVNTQTLFEKLTKMAIEKQFKLMYIFKDESANNCSHIKCLMPESKKPGDWSVSTWFESYNDCCEHAVQLANVIIFDDGKDGAFNIQAENYYMGRQLLAIPGNSGCWANQLIKNKKWTLCDSGYDIITAIESVKELEEE